MNKLCTTKLAPAPQWVFQPERQPPVGCYGTHVVAFLLPRKYEKAFQVKNFGFSSLLVGGDLKSYIPSTYLKIHSTSFSAFR